MTGREEDLVLIMNLPQLRYLVLVDVLVLMKMTILPSQLTANNDRGLQLHLHYLFKKILFQNRQSNLYSILGLNFVYYIFFKNRSSAATSHPSGSVAAKIMAKYGFRVFLKKIKIKKLREEIFISMF